MVLTLAIYLYYLVYRLVYTINWDAWWFSLLFYYAELHGFLSLTLYFFLIWHPLTRTPPPAPPNLRVDVYIPTYKEDIELVRKTVRGCLNITYPHTTYILDDGHRPECAALATELGCEYLTRTERVHAKAGNLNHALSVTRGDFIAIFDADYVPQPDFLDKTLGYLTDPHVAFVQTPQNYYNVDSFSFRFHQATHIKWNEGDMFYRLIMPGMDYWDSAFFAGTSAVFRRTAIDDVNGFAIETITEDLHTSVRLYKRGWKGIYHNEPLSSGLAATDLKDYHIQKLRWAEGNISLLFVDNPLFAKALTLPQRLCFFATVFSWFIGLPKLIYFITPAIMLLTNWYPVVPFNWPFIWRYTIFLTAVIATVKIVSRGYSRIRDEEVHNMMNFFVLMKAMVKALLRLKGRFVVTAKGAGETARFSTLIPQFTIIILGITAIEWGGLKWAYGTSHNWLGLGIGIFWSAVNAYLAWTVITKVTAPLHRRKESRFLGNLPVRYEHDDYGCAISGLGTVTDLTADGMGLTTFTALPLREPIRLRLHLGSRLFTCVGLVLYVHKTTSPTGIFRYGVQFTNLSRTDKDTITEFCFNQMLPIFLRQFDPTPSSLTRWLLSYTHGWFTPPSDHQPTSQLPLRIHTTPPHYVITEHITADTLTFLTYAPLSPETQTMVTLFTPQGQFTTTITIHHCKDIVVGRWYRITASFMTQPEHASDALTTFLEAHSSCSPA